MLLGKANGYNSRYHFKVVYSILLVERDLVTQYRVSDVVKVVRTM